jgi:ribonuclease PH
MSGEESTFSEAELASLLTLGKAGIRALIEKQRQAIGDVSMAIPAHRRQP